MALSRQMLPLALALALIGAAPAWAQGGATGPAARAQGDVAARAALLAERQRLRVELDRANAEIDSLKRANRSLRDDYRLRARLADAEALARRLTELDARLGAGPAARESWTSAGTEPRGLPSDGPAELEAKADILSDQARRLAARGEALLVRAHDLKARQNLRRRVGQMERDPFSPLEGSKRRAMAVGTPTVTQSPSKNVQPGLSGGSPPAGGGQSSAPATSTDQTTAPPSAGGAGLAPTSGAGASDRGPASISATPPPSQPLGGAAVTAPKTGPTPTAPAGPAETSSLSAQLRDLLDPATLAELQKLEATAGPVSGVEALERAGAALKARADRLQREAAALRARTK
jgi:hypothetical protein